VQSVRGVVEGSYVKHADVRGSLTATHTGTHSLLQWSVDPVTCVLRIPIRPMSAYETFRIGSGCRLEGSSAASGFYNSIVTSIGPARGRGRDPSTAEPSNSE
jgi:hypothetical protein